MPLRAPVASLFVALAIGASTANAAGPTKQQCVAANESAQDLRRSGKLHEARTNLATCLSTSCPRLLREDCAQRLADIEAAIPTVVFVAKDAASNDLSDVRVSLDGAPLVEKLDGAAIAIDPGEHQFVFEAAGFRQIETTVVLHEGDKKRRVMVFLDSTAVEPPAPAPPSRAPTPPAPRESSGSDPGKTQRTLGLALGIGGVAGLAVGSVFGLVSKATFDHARTECSGGACTAQGHADVRSAFGQATIADIAFTAGGVLLVGGALLYLTAPTRNGGVALGPTIVDRGAGVALSGTW